MTLGYGRRQKTSDVDKRAYLGTRHYSQVLITRLRVLTSVVDSDPDPHRIQKWPTQKEKSEECRYCTGCFLWGAFPEALTFFMPKNTNFFQVSNFTIFSHQTLDPYLHWPKMLNPYLDPHWNQCESTTPVIFEANSHLGIFGRLPFLL